MLGLLVSLLIGCQKESIDSSPARYVTILNGTVQDEHRQIDIAHTMRGNWEVTNVYANIYDNDGSGMGVYSHRIDLSYTGDILTVAGGEAYDGLETGFIENLGPQIYTFNFSDSEGSVIITGGCCGYNTELNINRFVQNGTSGGLTTGDYIVTEISETRMLLLNQRDVVDITDNYPDNVFIVLERR
jgi:hypothetical protein